MAISNRARNAKNLRNAQLSGIIQTKIAHSTPRRPIFLCCGAALASMPLGYLAIRAPSQTWFGMIEFHLFHRGDHWTDITGHNLHEILRWTTSIQGVLLVFL